MTDLINIIDYVTKEESLKELEIKTLQYNDDYGEVDIFINGDPDIDEYNKKEYYKNLEEITRSDICLNDNMPTDIRTNKKDNNIKTSIYLNNLMNINDEKKKEIYLLKHKFYEQDNEKLTDDSVIKCGEPDFSKSKKIAYQTIFDISEYNRLIDNGNGNKNLSSALKVHICLKYNGGGGNILEAEAKAEPEAKAKAKAKA